MMNVPGWGMPDWREPLRPGFSNILYSRISEQRISDLLVLCIAGQNFHRIVRNRDGGDTGPLEFGQFELQLHELPFAESSPVGRAMEDHGDLSALQHGGQRLVIPFLILEGEFRRLVAHLQRMIRRRRVMLGNSGEWQGHQSGEGNGFGEEAFHSHLGRPVTGPGEE